MGGGYTAQESSQRLPSPVPGRVRLLQRGVSQSLFWRLEATALLELEERPGPFERRELHFRLVEGDFDELVVCAATTLCAPPAHSLPPPLTPPRALVLGCRQRKPSEVFRSRQTRRRLTEVLRSSSNMEQRRCLCEPKGQWETRETSSKANFPPVCVSFGSFTCSQTRHVAGLPCLTRGP